MTDRDTPEHRSYSEAEIGALIKRATELHEKATGASEYRLSLKEIEHIAAELGLPPEHLQAAALELEDRRLSDKSFSLWGAPFVINQTRVVNQTMTEEQWEDIVLELRRFSGSTGETSALGRARQWMHAFGEGDGGFSFEKTQVTIRPGDDQTSIQIQKRYDGAAVLYPVTFFFTAFASLMAFHSLPDMAKLTELALAGLSGLGSLGGVRAFISWGAKRHAERITQLADLIKERLSAPAASAERVASRVELAEPGIEVEETEGSPTARRRVR